jgi:hypothetical protein
MSCANDGGAMPDVVSQRLALKVVAQVPAAGTLVGLNLLRDGPRRIPALSDFPGFPTERSQVHLLVSCPTQPTHVPELEPTSPTTAPPDPLTGPQPFSQPDPITLLVLGGAAGVAGAVAARAIGRRRKVDPSVVAAGEAFEQLPPGRVEVRGRPDIP